MTPRPRVLLADEPTAGLDSLLTGTVDDAIVAARKAPGVTAFIITLDLPTAFRIADRLASCLTGASNRMVSCQGGPWPRPRLTRERVASRQSHRFDVKNCRSPSSERTVEAGERSV
jgi:ABC-type nitrate/sulfonate/bicarbonate transport system ATPase subunit